MGIIKDQFELLGLDYFDCVFGILDCNVLMFCNFQCFYGFGCLVNFGYLLIFLVDQGIEYLGVVLFVLNLIYFDFVKIVELVIEGGCNGVVLMFGVFGIVLCCYVYKILFIVKINYNEIFMYFNCYKQVFFVQVEQVWDFGVVVVGVMIYFGVENCDEMFVEIVECFVKVYEFGFGMIFWCYLCNLDFKKDGVDYYVVVDLMGQVNYFGVIIEVDIIKQKMVMNNGGYLVIDFGKMYDFVYSDLVLDYLVDFVCWQVVNCYMGCVGFINFGGVLGGSSDFVQVVCIVVINKCVGGVGLIFGCKVFQ